MIKGKRLKTKEDLDAHLGAKVIFDNGEVYSDCILTKGDNFYYVCSNHEEINGHNELTTHGKKYSWSFAHIPIFPEDSFQTGSCKIYLQEEGIKVGENDPFFDIMYKDKEMWMFINYVVEELNPRRKEWGVAPITVEQAMICYKTLTEFKDKWCKE